MAKRADISKYSLESVDRMAIVLSALEASGSNSLEQVAQTAGLSEATVLRYLSSLAKHGFVEREATTGEYRLGLSLFRLGSLAIRQRDVGAVAGPFMETIRDRFHETVNLAAKHRKQVILVKVLESESPLPMGGRAGEIDAWHSTALGKVLLSAMPELEMNDIIDTINFTPFTPNTLTTQSALVRDLEAVRHRAYAIDDEESAEGQRCVGTVVFDHAGLPRYALSVSGPKSRMPYSRLQEIGGYLVDASGQLSRNLGGESRNLGKALVLGK